MNSEEDPIKPQFVISRIDLAKEKFHITHLIWKYDSVKNETKIQVEC